MPSSRSGVATCHRATINTNAKSMVKPAYTAPTCLVREVAPVLDEPAGLSVVTSNRMAVQTLVSEQEYLAMHFEHDAEWVDGEVIERSFPMRDHARAQVELVLVTPSHYGGKSLYRYTELRVRIGTHYRVIDFCIYKDRPSAQCPTVPPFLAVEILSPDDAMSKVVSKFAEYAAWGVAQIWLADPMSRQFYRYDRRLVPMDELSVPELGLHITPDALFVE